jgi:hypothetical protein
MMYSAELAKLMIEERQRAISRATRRAPIDGRNGRDAPTRRIAELPRPPFYYRGIAASVWRAALRRAGAHATTPMPGPDRGPAPVRLCS